ncbi:hypothetical protein O6H91_20G072800 [Diphasiastrum complanatum]|uniref:Uncharacterized protein n=1 Tax=Diphasiastrum complanatum TaxID=34168 RepID=A0ACC2ARN9_DIPCM|nr:hypothetical protein O6H91_20G072800 [Diphasiastrum complanatum]
MNANRNARPSTATHPVHGVEQYPILKVKARKRPLKLQSKAPQQRKEALRKDNRTVGKTGKVENEKFGIKKLGPSKRSEVKPSKSLKIKPLTIRPKKKSHSRYRALKRKCTLLEEERYALAEELEETQAEIKELEKEKLALLDKLLIWEGLDANPFPPFQQLAYKTL